LHLEVEIDGAPREVVAEQLFGTTFAENVPNLLCDGLHWTPVSEFARRDRHGWHVTVPATAFRDVDQATVREAVARLAGLRGHPFLTEDCVRFVERAFGDRRLFADSPLFKLLGLDVRVADPALPLLRPDVRLESCAAMLLRTAALRTLPDAQGRADRVSAARRIVLSALALLAACVAPAWRRRGAGVAG
jgi:hypothetical protein